MDFSLIILIYVVLLASLVVHEAAHALVALWGGDRTAYLGGQVTLNPIPHIRREPFGTVILPLVMLFMTGMCLGYASTPIDPIWAYRNPKKAAVMSLAGPVSNFLLAIVAFAVLYLLIHFDAAYYTGGTFVESKDSLIDAICRMGSVFVLLNLLLGLLNLIPIPPLDGAGVVEGLFQKQVSGIYALLRGQPIFLMIGILILVNVSYEYFWALHRMVMDLLP